MSPIMSLHRLWCELRSLLQIAAVAAVFIGWMLFQLSKQCIKVLKSSVQGKGKHQ